MTTTPTATPITERVPTTPGTGSTAPNTGPTTAAAHLPQLRADVFLTDGGIETSLIYDDGLELPDFAAFVLLDQPDGRAALERYFAAYLAVAAQSDVGIVLETPTWRASADWGARLGYSPERLTEVNRDAVRLVRAVAAGTSVPVVVSGCIGPRGDGYDPGEEMTPAEARAYHALQARAFAAEGVDLVTGITMTNVPEAIGLVEAARAVDLPAVASFTVETDGRLPTGQPLAEAVTAVDEATDAYAAYYMVNCAHPTHFADVLEPGAPWTARLGGIRANASRMSHAELDAATELDAGDPHELAAEYRALRATHPDLVVLGGCCGTNHEHVAAIAAACG